MAEKINYLELPACNIAASQRFFSEAFGWFFTDYGPDYTAFSHVQTGIDGGFYKSDKVVDANIGSVLVVFYSPELEAIHAKIQACGGVIKRDIFNFPGGRRFHFTDPSGNEFAVWSDK